MPEQPRSDAKASMNRQTHNSDMQLQEKATMIFQDAHCFIAATALPPESPIDKQSPHVLDTYRIAHMLG
ncbi:hypothetical protein BOTCAL_0221g00120 [Botryotinia calthae]|uniref:Uncharacterized protein n=1 Tax=Botryotinia calthae TaxID=38488 RepID=A0A4Y8D0V6_9HELO|nr:hypothetical protein BOTCAL_0221g00120 [Botryotinia calthae]